MLVTPLSVLPLTINVTIEIGLALGVQMEISQQFSLLIFAFNFTDWAKTVNTVQESLLQELIAYL